MHDASGTEDLYAVYILPLIVERRTIFGCKICRITDHCIISIVSSIKFFLNFFFYSKFALRTQSPCVGAILPVLGEHRHGFVRCGMVYPHQPSSSHPPPPSLNLRTTGWNQWFSRGSPPTENSAGMSETQLSSDLACDLSDSETGVKTSDNECF